MVNERAGAEVGTGAIAVNLKAKVLLDSTKARATSAPMRSNLALLVA
jgi:hypothetical protein